MNKKTLIGVVVVILIAGIGIWKMASNNASKDVASNSSSNVEEKSDSNQSDSKDGKSEDQKKAEDKNNESSNGDSENSDKTDADNSSSDNLTNVNNISGFTSEKGSNSNSGNKVDSNSNKNNSNKSSKISLPYIIASTGMKVTNIGKYSGKFVENGSDKSVSNVLSIVVTNTSKKDLQYGEIKLKAGDKTATFKLTNIPSGKFVLALEVNGMKYSSKANYQYADATYAQTDMPINSNKVKVSTSDSKVTIKNISGKDLGIVYVYYKNLDKSGAYLGGITYRVKFDNVKKGDTLSQNTKHFSKSNSKIVMVDTEK